MVPGVFGGVSSLFLSRVARTTSWSVFEDILDWCLVHCWCDDMALEWLVVGRVLR